jgi:hypothetical protein
MSGGGEEDMSRSRPGMDRGVIIFWLRARYRVSPNRTRNGASAMP